MTRAPRIVSIISSILGAGALAALAAASALPVISSEIAGPEPAEALAPVPAGELTEIQVESERASVTVRFGDVPAARLDAPEGSALPWRWEIADRTLVASNVRPFSGVCFFWCDDRTEEVTITLPEDLEGELAADFELASGGLAAAGDFTRVDIEVAAGTLRYTGATPALDVEVNAGSAALDAADVRTAQFEVSAGKLTAELLGAAPDLVQAELAAGQLDLTVPDAAYRVRSEVSAGTLQNNLRTSPNSAHVLDIELAAGRATLNAGG